MGELLEILHNMLTDGITWATVISLVLAWHKWKEGKQKKVAYERMEAKINMIMEKEGVEWGGQPNESKKDQMNLSKWPQLFLAGPLKIYVRSVKKVKVSKAWLSGVIAYLFGQLAIKYGFTFNDAMADTVADFIITLVIPMFLAYMNRTKREGESIESTVLRESNK